MRSLVAVLVIAVIVAAFAFGRDAGVCALVGGLVGMLIARRQEFSVAANSPNAGAAQNTRVDPNAGAGPSEHFTVEPGPAIIESLVEPYPGAVDEDFSEDYPGEYGGGGCVAEGDPRNLSGLRSPPGGPPCFDREANDDEMDGDERMAYQVRGRNDPLRPTLGATKRVALLDEAVREELEESEDLPWWGRHEQ